MPTTGKGAEKEDAMKWSLSRSQWRSMTRARDHDAKRDKTERQKV